MKTETLSVTTLMTYLHDLGDQLIDKVHIAFLFTESDISSIIGPTLAVAVLLGGPTDIQSFILAFLWMELHLIAFEIQNQIVGLEEDKLSKPHRPIAAGRISVKDAQTLYYAVFALSFLYSIYHDLVVCSAVYLVFTVAYNEFGLARNWVFKSALAAVGYVCYCWGTTFIVGHHAPLSSTASIACYISGLIHLTTSYAQDFRDRTGDAAIGRKTLPIMLPQWFARWSLVALLLAWTAGLVWMWQPPVVVSTLFLALCVVASHTYVSNYTEESDRDAYWWYNMWLIMAHVVPVFKRLADSGIKLAF